MGKDKPAVLRGFMYLVDRGVDIAAVVGPRDGGGPGRLLRAAADNGVPARSDAEVVAELESGSLTGIDLVISLLFWKRIGSTLLGAPRLGCINFHPAPLPDFRGVGGYSIAIYEEVSEWGVSAHFVDDEFDTGDIIEVRRFAIDPSVETAWSLERKSQKALEALFQDVVGSLLAGEPLPRIPQGEGRYVDAGVFEELRRIEQGDDAASIRRKIRAFWFPPHGGASLTVAGADFTLVDDFVLRETAAWLESGHD